MKLIAFFSLLSLVSFVALRGDPQLVDVKAEGIGFVSDQNFYDRTAVVSFVGDVNGDRIDDFFVATNSTFEEGACYLHYGSSEVGNPGELKFVNETADAIFSDYRIGPYGSVLGLGDVNGDNLGDFLITAYDFNNFSYSAYLFYGRRQGSHFSGEYSYSSADATFVGFRPDTWAGSHSYGSGDLNGDEVNDLYFVTSREVYILYGKTGESKWSGSHILRDSADVTINVDDRLSTIFQSASTVINDFNGDGIGDLIFTGNSYLVDDETGYYLQGSRRIEAYVFFGGNLSNGLDQTMADIRFVTKRGDLFIYLGIATGDFNGDNVEDLALSNKGYDASVSGTDDTRNGQVYINYGHPNGIYEELIQLEEESDAILTGSDFSDFGASLSLDGDYNGDGVKDLVVGVQPQIGYFIYFGEKGDRMLAGNLGENDADVKINGFDHFGSWHPRSTSRFYNIYNRETTSCAAGDLDNDQLDELLLGAWFHYSSGVRENGGAYLLRFQEAQFDYFSDTQYFDYDHKGRLIIRKIDEVLDNGYVYDEEGNLESFYQDTDGDGLSDEFEDLVIQVSDTDGFRSYDDVLPSGDFDGDGILNIEELEALSFPVDGKTPSSVLFKADQLNSGELSFDLNLLAGFTYYISGTTNLQEWSSDNFMVNFPATVSFQKLDDSFMFQAENGGRFTLTINPVGEFPNAMFFRVYTLGE